MGAETRYAAVETAAEYEEMYPEYAECRNNNHPWKTVKAKVIAPRFGGGNEVVSVCLRCKGIRTQYIKRGVVIRVSYKYPPEFLMPPGGIKRSPRGGRIPTGGNRAVLRDLAVQRIIAQQREANQATAPTLRVVKEAS